jgi:hypothetical protein
VHRQAGGTQHGRQPQNTHGPSSVRSVHDRKRAPGPFVTSWWPVEATSSPRPATRSPLPAAVSSARSSPRRGFERRRIRSGGDPRSCKQTIRLGRTPLLPSCRRDQGAPSIHFRLIAVDPQASDDAIECGSVPRRDHGILEIHQVASLGLFKRDVEPSVTSVARPLAQPAVGPSPPRTRAVVSPDDAVASSAATWGGAGG